MQLLQLFLFCYRCLSNQLFLLFIDDIFGSAANCRTQEEFAIIILICIDFLNSLRSLDTIFITTENCLNSLKVIFTKKFQTETAIFCCFHISFVRPSQIFHVQAKISTICPVFLGYLSASYDYGQT